MEPIVKQPHVNAPSNTMMRSRTTVETIIDARWATPSGVSSICRSNRCIRGSGRIPNRRRDIGAIV